MAAKKKLKTFTVRGTAQARVWCEVEAVDAKEALRVAEDNDDWVMGDYLESPTADYAKEEP